MKELIPEEVIERKIFMIRGHKVMLDRDLAGLYGVKTRNLNKAVTRNLDRFPEDFMFQLNVFSCPVLEPPYQFVPGLRSKMSLIS